VLELPKETQETTSAMRRVVSEQIKALGELSDIVTRSGRSFDVAQPVATMQPAPAPAQPVQPAPQPMLATRIETAPPRFAEPRQEARPEPHQEPRQDFRPPVEPQRPAAQPPQRVMLDEPAPVLRPTLPPRDMQRPAAPPVAQTPPPKPASDTRRNFGLSDILSRVNWDETPAEKATPAPQQPQANAPGRALELIDSLSAQIGTLIDHISAVDMWDRYQAGQNDAISRRIYTVRGQQNFEELARRYRREPDVRATVDRYVDEFERLLNEATQDDRDGRIARAYLTSDTGKVYTLLAHASGRLG
ncbi:MAG: hypothetical protein ACRCXM_11685, partial [Beijerinckiaceae bacterium]